MSNSPLVVYTKLSPFNSGRRQHSIDRISPHCIVGQCSIESLGGWMSQPTARCSCNYGIGSDGRIGLIVDEGNRSWCTSSSANDQRAVTIECASDTTHPYAFKDVVYKQLIKLCVDICKRNGKNKLIWFGDKDKTLNYSPKSGEMILTVHRWFANKACVPTYSEVLTRKGWKRIDEVEAGEEIACADLDNLKVTFEEVYDNVPVRQQDTYTNNGLTATKDHRMVYSIHNNGNHRIDNYNNLLNDGNNIYIPMAGKANFDGLPLSDAMIRFYVATQADGHYMNDELVNGSTIYIGIEFHLKKERKIERIKEILQECNFDWTERKKSDGSTSIRIYNADGVNYVKDVCEKYLDNKVFTWDWMNLSPDQAKVFLDEVLLWDGCTAANLYTSTIKQNIDVVSAVAALNNVGSRVNGNNIQFRDNPYITLSKENTQRHTKQHEGRHTEVTCVSVKTGIFIMRQNGKTFVTGNCPGDWLYSRLGDLANKVNAQLSAPSGGSSSATSPSTGEEISDGSGLPYMVRVTIDDLYIRSGPGAGYKNKGFIPPGAYTIVQEKKANGLVWGKLKSGVGWICLKYATKI